MKEIHQNLLWLGHALDIREPRALLDARITAVVDVAIEEPPAQLPRQLIYCRFPINDGGGNEPPVLLHAVQSTVDLLGFGKRTIVACSAGMSRSPTIAACSLASFLDESPDDVILRISRLKALDVNGMLWNDVARVYSLIRKTPDSDKLN